MTEEENKIITFLSTKIQEKEWPNINTALDQMSNFSTEGNKQKCILVTFM